MDSKQLPDNWAITKLGVLSNLIRGVSYKKTDASQIKTDIFNIHILRGGNIQDGSIVAGKDEVYVNLELIKKTQFIKKADVVIVGSTGSKKLIGKAGIALQDYNDTAFGAFLMLARANKKINSNYFAYFFLSKFYRDKIRELAGGVNINNIRKEHINDMRFPLPPRIEQDRIVAKVDTLMAQAQAMQKSLACLPRLLNDFRQQVLTQAVTGKLTENWRITHNLSSEVDLERISHLRNTFLSKRDKKEENYIEWQNQVEIPEKWTWIKLWELSYLITSGSRGWSKYYSDHGAYFVRSAEINNNKLRLEEAIKVELPRKVEGKRSLIEKGDLLITITGANVGKCACITEQIPESYVSQSVALIKLVDIDISKYVHLVLLSQNTGGKQIENMAYGMGRPVLNLPQIKSIEIPFPSKKEQVEIVCRVDNLFAKADKIQEKYEILKLKIDSLPQAILHKAFNGELVEQLPTEGDARELLKEIEKLKKS